MLPLVRYAVDYAPLLASMANWACREVGQVRPATWNALNRVFETLPQSKPANATTRCPLGRSDPRYDAAVGRRVRMSEIAQVVGWVLLGALALAIAGAAVVLLLAGLKGALRAAGPTTHSRVTSALEAAT
jgi:hypothetical protein